MHTVSSWPLGLTLQRKQLPPADPAGKCQEPVWSQQILYPALPHFCGVSQHHRCAVLPMPKVLRVPLAAWVPCLMMVRCAYDRNVATLCCELSQPAGQGIGSLHETELTAVHQHALNLPTWVHPFWQL
jgi:hypothetical protein